jgi:hypothetical protein
MLVSIVVSLTTVLEHEHAKPGGEKTAIMTQIMVGDGTVALAFHHGKSE